MVMRQESHMGTMFRSTSLPVYTLLSGKHSTVSQLHQTLIFLETGSTQDSKDSPEVLLKAVIRSTGEHMMYKTADVCFL